VACVVSLAALCDMRCSAQPTAVTSQQAGTELSREEKQLALDLHNFLRASQQAANMRQLVSGMSMKAVHPLQTRYLGFVVTNSVSG